MRKSVLFLVVLVLSTIPTATSSIEAQTTDPSPSEWLIIDVDRSDSPEIAVTVAPPDRSIFQRPTADDFEVREGDQVVLIERMETVDVERAAVVLAIDTSGSMRGEALERAVAAAQTFVESLPPQTPVSVLGFGDSKVTGSGFSSDHEAIIEELAALEASGETALYDALVVAAQSLQEVPDIQRRAVVLISDGGDTASVASDTDAIEALSEAGVDVCAIALETSESDSELLERLVESANGLLVEADRDSVLKIVEQKLPALVTQHYRLIVQSTSSAETPMPLSVSIQLADSADPDERVTIVPDDAAGRDESAALTPTKTTLPPPPEPRQLSAPSPLTGSIAFGAGIALMTVSFTGLALALMLTRRTVRRRKRQSFGGGHLGMAAITDAMSRVADATIERRGWGPAIDKRLEAAALDLRPGEFGVIAGAVGIALGAIGLIGSGRLLALVLFLAGPFLAWKWLGFRTKRRRKKFSAQLVTTLQLMGSGLRAGYGIQQAIDAVASEAESPTRDEFQRIVVETRLGRELTSSLHALAERMDSVDLVWAVRAIEINRKIGGDLAEVLDNVGNTIRGRQQVHLKVKALSSEGRSSAGLLFSLPFILSITIEVMNPGYVTVLFKSPTGWLLLAIAGTLLTVGAVWLKSMINVKF